jgi:FixJ family two-component response regulator
VVDDDPAVRSSLCWLISSLDLDVQSFPSASAFLDAVSPLQRGCAIVDVRMPGVSGLRLQREIKERYPHLATIIMSAYGSHDSAARAIEQGALGYLEKPINDEALLDLVRKGLERHLAGDADPQLPV